MKKNRHWPLISILLLAILFASFGARGQANPQANYDLKQMLPTSPEAALLGRFGDIPIGYYTGTADISIPLYTIKEDGLEVPITLSYHSSGIKVEDQATNVGLGWLLEPGGAVIQVVNGMADQTDNFAGTLPSDYSFLLANITNLGEHSARGSIGVGTETCSDAPNDGDTQASMDALQSGELQPDIFQYNFPGGYSGKFYINPQTKKIVMIDKQKQIFFQQNVNGTNWFAETLDGDKYYFNDEETATDGSSGHQGFTFKLSQIVLHNGKTINFSYTNSSYNWSSGYSEFYHTPYPGDVSSLESSSEYSIQGQSYNANYYNKTITQIKTADVIINFNQGTRTDMQAPCIQSVDILSAVTGQKIKTFTFNYGYFAYSQVGNAATGTNLTGQRLKLLSVQETGYDPVSGLASSNPPYQFTYNETAPLPMKTSLAKDFWGYYNGVNNTRLLTDLTYPYFAGMLGSNFPYATLASIQGGNRATDTSQVGLGMLTKIAYPTGGYTHFNYESNSFSNYDYPDVNKEATRLTTLRAEDQNAPTDNATITFTTNRDLTYPINILFSRGYPTNPVTYAQMSPGYVTINEIKNGTTTVLKTWQISSSAQQTTFTNTGNVAIQDNIFIPYDPAATYQLVASLPDAIGNQTGSSTLGANVTASITYYNVPNNVTANLSYGGGVRVSSIVDYDYTGALISNKSLKYVNAAGMPSGILMSPLLLTYYRYLSFADEVSTSPEQVNTANANIWYLSSDSFVPLSNAAGGNLVGYSRVEETQLNNDVETNGKHVYAYNNLPSETGYATPDNPDLRNGKIDTDFVYNHSGNLLLENTYSYSSLSDSLVTGFKNFNNIVSNGVGCARMDGVIPGFAIYNILEYPINSHWYMLTNKTTTHYDGTTPLTETTTYAYNAMGQLSQESTTSSKNETLLTSYIYPYDQASTSATALLLVDSCFYNNLLEQHMFNNGVETTEAKISYNTINNQLVKSGITRSYNGGTSFTDATFDAYGPNKSLQQVTERAVQPSAFLYDYNNKYLLADVKNATITDIAYTSFEQNQPGNWTIGSASRAPFGLSGSQSFSLANGTVSKTGLTSTTTYIVSYWTTGSSPLTIAGTITGFPIKGATIGAWTYYVYQVTGQTSVTLSGTGNIDEVRLYPNNALMKTFTYNPLIGITSTVSEKNQVNYYEYDNFQRLMNIKDKDRNIIKHTDYHYQGQ